MVFHEIDSITDVNVGHRIIVYYIKKNANESMLCNAAESALGRLEKKNDDLLIVKVIFDSLQFDKFQALYKAEVLGVVTLFAVNNEGIPVTSQHVNKEENIFLAIESLCDICKLNKISAIEMERPSLKSSIMETTDSTLENNLELRGTVSSSKHSDSSSKFSGLSETNKEKTCQPLTTQLQIRLPDGNRDTQKFDKDAELNEVKLFVSSNYKIKDFDLKTYNHQAFSEDEYGKTLKDLDLYPNGVIIVVPKNCVSFNQNGGLGTMVRYGWNRLATNLTFAFGYFQAILVMFWNSLFSSRSNSDSNQSRNHANSDRANGQSTSKNSSSRYTTKSTGNIHTLHKKDDSDDENNRYNGNSTQQK